MKPIIRPIMFMLLLLLNSCEAQKKDKIDEATYGFLAKATDTIKRPRIDIKVNRKFDSQGRLIQFDSTYSYVYKSSGDNFITNDSLIQNFEKLLENPFGHMYGSQKSPMLFFNDTLISKDFFGSDIIEKLLDTEKRQLLRQNKRTKKKPLHEEQKITKPYKII